MEPGTDNQSTAHEIKRREDKQTVIASHTTQQPRE
jgi:hypothetical protein